MGKSKLRTQATSTKSTPRVTPYSLSPPFFLCFRLRDAELSARLRFFEGCVSLSSSFVVESRWVEVTVKCVNEFLGLGQI